MNNTAFRADLEELRKELQSQDDKIAAQAAELTLLRSRPTQPRLPDPERFAGDPEKYDAWLHAIKVKLRFDGQVIGDAEAQFYYVYFNLEGQVQTQVLPQLSRAESSRSWDYADILQQLSRIYDGQSYRAQAAQEILLDNAQGSDSVAMYTAKYEMYLYQARYTDWPGANKIYTYQKGLNSVIRSRLAQEPSLPQGYADFLRFVEQLARSCDFSSRSSPRVSPRVEVPATAEDDGNRNYDSDYIPDTPPKKSGARSTGKHSRFFSR